VLQGPEEARRQLRRLVSIQITTSKRTNVIISEGQPIDVNIDSRVVFGPDPSDVTSIRPDGRLNANTQYRVNSTVSNASVARLQAAPAAYAPWLQPYLQLPDDLPLSVRSKAREVTLSGATPYDKANLLEQYLRTFPVDTKIDPAPPKQDSVDYFLFTAGRGYFDYHATAMVVMLRSLGIPSRLAVGYITRPQDKLPDTDIYIVQEDNAFAWPEVYFPGLGWVEFNPTPNEARVPRTGSDDQVFSGDLPVEEEEPPLDGAVPPDIQEATQALDQLQLDEGPSLVSRIVLGIVLAVLAVTATAGGIFHYSWQHGLGGLPYSVQIWEKTLRLARWAKIKPTPQETPRELLARLRRELPDVEDLDYLGDSFIRARYGQKELVEAEQQRLMLVLNQVRNTLLQLLLRWK
jgi:transglutaminase-like putative cysteine protease